MSGAGAKARLATVWLDGCAGCHMSLLDVDEVLIALAPRIDLVFGPLVDAQSFPEGVDVTLVEGAVSSQDDLRMAHTLRARSGLVVALGDCAVTANVPSMRNGLPVKLLLKRIYVEGADATPQIPTDGVPQLNRQVVALHEVIPVDLHVPGCPPKAGAIAHVLLELLEGRKVDLAGQVRFG
jgi:NAD-reducing hydrogenase small subunit